MAKVARKPKKKKSGLLITLIIIVVILLIAVAGLGWYSANLKPSSDFKQEKLIEVKEGSYLTDVVCGCRLILPFRSGLWQCRIQGIGGLGYACDGGVGGGV